MRKVAGWLRIALLTVLIAALVVGDRSRETAIQLSVAGRATLALAFVLGCVLSASVYTRDSSSRFGLAHLISLRERAWSKWLMRGAALSIGMGVMFAVLSWFYVAGIVTHLSGDRVEQQGVVQRVITTG